MNIVLIKDFIKITKTKIISILIFSALILALSIIFQIYAQISEVVVPSIRERPENRMIYVSEVEDFNKINNILSINKTESVLNYINSMNGYSESFGDIIISSRLLNDKMKILIGRDLIDKNYEIIISDYLYQNDQNLIGSIVELVVGDKKFKCKVVGVYKNYITLSNNKVYISEKISNQIHNNNEYIITINEQRHVNSIIKQLNFQQINARLFDSSYIVEMNTYDKLLNVVNLFIMIIVVVFVNYMFIFINNFINEKIKAIVILKLSGYSNFKISINIVLSMLVWIFSLYFLFNIVIWLSFWILKLFLSTSITYFFNYSFYLILIIITIILIITLLLIYRIKNKKILKLLYES